MTLKEKLDAKCKETNTSVQGINFLLEYYRSSLGWDEDRAIDYVLELFDNGTIEAIKIIGKDGKKI